MLKTMVWTMQYQSQHHRFFLFENPPRSAIWAEPIFAPVYEISGVLSGIGHACAYRKLCVSGQAYLWKEHRWLANHRLLIQATCSKCPGGPDHAIHVSTSGSESKPSGQYSLDLVQSILRAIRSLAEANQRCYSSCGSNVASVGPCLFAHTPSSSMAALLFPKYQVPEDSADLAASAGQRLQFGNPDVEHPGSQLAEGALIMDKEEVAPPDHNLYQHGGKTYRNKTNSEINGAIDLDRVQEYVQRLGNRPLAAPLDPSTEVPYESIEDFEVTLRNACSNNGSAFMWPSQEFSFNRAITVALHLCPGDSMFVIENGRRPPAWMFAPGGQLRPDLTELYHGAPVHVAPAIGEFGYAPTLGAGAEAMLEHFGVTVPGIYMAKDFKTALYYPNGITTHDKAGGCAGGVAGGSLIATDGTLPYRFVT